MNLKTRLMVIANHLPGMNDPSGALGQRILALETSRSWAGKEDKQLTDRLFAELPGILCWSLSGWRRLQKRGYFRQPQSSQHLVQQYTSIPLADAMPKMHRVRATVPNRNRSAGKQSDAEEFNISVYQDTINIVIQKKAPSK